MREVTLLRHVLSLCCCKYPPILCRDYLSQRYNDTHAVLKIYKKQQS